MRVACLLCLFAFSFVFGEEIHTFGSNEVDYWVWEEDYKEHFEDKFILNLSYKEFKTKIGYFFYTPSDLDASIEYSIFSFEYDKSPFNILLGDYYATFGRGLCLREYLDAEFKHDKSLRGLKARLAFKNTSITLISGYPQNLFFENNVYRIVNPTTDLIRGVDMEAKLPSLNFGGRYLRLNREQDPAPHSFTELFGGDIEVSFDPVDVYFEYAKKLGYKPVIGTKMDGQGIYLATSFSLSGFGVSAEYLDYDSLGCGGFGYRYNDPPTPNRRGMSINRGMDERGYGIAGTYLLFEDISVEASYSNLETENESQWISESYAKIESYPTDYISLSTSLDRLGEKKIEPEIDHKTETEPELEITYNLTPRNAIKVGYACNFIKEDTLDFLESTYSFSYSCLPNLTLNLRAEHRSKKIERLESRTFWFMGEITIDISQNANFRVMLGSEKGGLVCSGGVCRWEEPFRGVKVSLINTF